MPNIETAHTVQSEAELVELVELTSITYLEYSGRREETSLQEESTTAAQVKHTAMHRMSPSVLTFRLRTEVETRHGEYVVDIASDYASKKEVAVSREIMNAFLERVALISLWPYTRIAVHELTSRFEGEGLLLGLYRPTHGLQSKDSADDQATEDSDNMAP